MDPVSIGLGLGSIAGGIFGSRGAKRAARIQAAAMDRATQESQRQYDQTRNDYMPYTQTGYGGLSNLNAVNSGDMSRFYTDPGYQFTLNEGTRALQRGAAARGGLYSGAAGKALTRYGQDAASMQFGNYWNRQMGLAGLGLRATSDVGQFGAQNAQNIGNLAVGAGNARAQGVMNSTNAWTNTLGQLGGLAGLYAGGYFNPGRQLQQGPGYGYTPYSGFGGIDWGSMPR